MYQVMVVLDQLLPAHFFKIDHQTRVLLHYVVVHIVSPKRKIHPHVKAQLFNWTGQNDSVSAAFNGSDL